jgi:DNA polymerase-3 subunit epsilon
MRDRVEGSRVGLPAELVVLDLETTGLSAESDAILEVGACVLDSSLAVRSEFYSRVHTKKQISRGASLTHGLRSEDLADAPPLEVVLDRLLEAVPPGALLAGHNVAFDAGFLRAGFASAGRRFPFDYHLVDIWSLAYFVLGTRGVRLPRYNLTALCGVFGIQREPLHNALQDARASAAILRHLAQVVGGRDIDVFGQFSIDVEERE